MARLDAEKVTEIRLRHCRVHENVRTTLRRPRYVRNGKGATWEGRLIQQDLYDAKGNYRFIPIVFEPADIDNIPLVLKGATYYDLSKADGYSRLHRALTNQPRVVRRPVGPVTKRLPDLDSDESKIVALMHLCPDPLPLEVVARVVGKDVAGVVTTLQRLVQTAVLKVENDVVRLADRSSDGIPAPLDESVGAALEAALHFSRSFQNAAGRTQMLNIVTLATAASLHNAAAQVSRTFRTIQSLLKSSGNKSLVLAVARRSIEASKARGREREQVKDEAVAAICGVSWVYQRTGRLAEALTEAERSLELGRAIEWDRNNAFCYKCLGRLKRMESETVQDAPRRVALLNDSADLLRKAINEFTKLKLESEVGDCYSLLARTHLATGDRGAADVAIGEACERLVDPTNKDYLDLQIVKGDLMAYSSSQAADSIYTEVLNDGANHDAQRSEIMARAYLHRGRLRATLGNSDRALADFRRAAEIWDELEDPTADEAHWEIIRRASWVDKETELLLEQEYFGVRVRAARIVGDETTARPAGTSHRRKLPRKYLLAVIDRAREQYVVDRPVW